MADEIRAAERGSNKAATDVGAEKKFDNADALSSSSKPELGDSSLTYELDPFTAHANLSGDHVNFRSMGWVQAGLVATAENIAMGALSFPSVFMRLGMVGGLVATIGLAALAYATCCIMIDFKMRHVGVMHYGDAGGLLFGPVGRRVFGTGMVLKSIGLGGSHVLGGKIALATLGSGAAVCSVWYAFLIAAVSVLMSYSREFGKLTVLAWASVSCILVASFITTVGTGVQSDDVLTKHGEPIEWHAFPKNPSLENIVGALTNIVFAYGGNMAVFSFCSEMRRPQDFKKSFVITQGVGATVYCIVGATVYAFGGQYVTSPALTMTTHTVSMVAYAFALVTILISGVVGVNVGAKYMYIVFFRNSTLLTSKSMRAQLGWIAIVVGFWVCSFALAEVIPFFNQLLTIVSSLFSVWFSYGLVGVIWFYNVHPRWAGPGEIRTLDGKWTKTFYGCAVLSIMLSVAMTPLGLYSAITGIISGVSFLLPPVLHLATRSKANSPFLSAVPKWHLRSPLLLRSWHLMPLLNSTEGRLRRELCEDFCTKLCHYHWNRLRIGQNGAKAANRPRVSSQKACGPFGIKNGHITHVHSRWKNNNVLKISGGSILGPFCMKIQSMDIANTDWSVSTIPVAYSEACPLFTNTYMLRKRRRAVSLSITTRLEKMKKKKKKPPRLWRSKGGG